MTEDEMNELEDAFSNLDNVIELDNKRWRRKARLQLAGIMLGCVTIGFLGRMIMEDDL